MVENTKTGWVIHPKNSHMIMEFLEKRITSSGTRDSLTPRTEKIKQYSLGEQMKKLNNSLIEVMKSR